MTNRQIFEDVFEFPDPIVQKRFDQLVGLDNVKHRLLKESRILLNPKLLEEWSEKNHKKIIPLIHGFQNRTPLFIFAGDVGTGKTSLAESFGTVVAREEKIGVTLYRLSLSARGTGAVGEMTRLLSNAFQEISAAATEGVSKEGRTTSAVILVIDEADAIAQSRELDQMHHEDRAGVNALIRGIDSLATEHLPVLVIMCTNRLDSLDPAVRRRAAATFQFSRPNDEQREKILTDSLADTGITEEEIQELVKLTGQQAGADYGFTYSDIVQRFLPALLLEAFPDSPVTYENALAIVKEMRPTPPFKESIK